ncbi:MAG: hypothetical protein AAGI22_15945, partial [Planctomycetota bacterium]
MLGSYRPGSPLVAAMTLCVGVTVTLTAWGHVSQRNVAALRPALDAQQALLDGTISPADIPPLDLGSTVSLEGQLAPYMPLAGLHRAGVLERVEPSGTPRSVETREQPREDRSYQMTVDELRERRGPGWRYPAFDTYGRHGAPLLAGPRNVTVRIVDVNDEPIVAELLQVKQSGDDGAFAPNAYRTGVDPTEWTIGSPLLSPGGEAKFELVAHTGAGVFVMVTTVASVPDRG